MPISGFGNDFFDVVMNSARDNLTGFVQQLPAFPSLDPAPLPQFGQQGSPLDFDFGGFGQGTPLSFDFGGSNPFSDLPFFGPSGGRAGEGGLGQMLTNDMNAARQAGVQSRAQAAQNQAPAQVQARPGIPNNGVYKPTRSDTRIAQRIYAEATRLGLDPEFAAWVAENEGGLDDAAANRQNRRGSTAYGPYQLLIDGGLGDAALAAGIDPRDAGSWERQITFALEHVAQNGWGAWEAVTARGIDPMTGVRAPAAASVPAPAPQAQPTGSVPRPAYRTNVPYGQRYSKPFSPTLTHHQGVDLILDGPNQGRGSPVPAFTGGTVIYLDRDLNGGLGVGIRDGQGHDHFYFHLDSAAVRMGQTVSPGGAIGTLGASGINLDDPVEGGPHLHYEVRVQGTRQSVDPTPWMR